MSSLWSYGGNEAKNESHKVKQNASIFTLIHIRVCTWITMPLGTTRCLNNISDLSIICQVHIIIKYIDFIFVLIVVDVIIQAINFILLHIGKVLTDKRTLTSELRTDVPDLKFNLRIVSVDLILPICIKFGKVNLT